MSTVSALAASGVGNPQATAVAQGSYGEACGVSGA